jgi:hypothetical protein
MAPHWLRHPAPAASATSRAVPGDGLVPVRHLAFGWLPGRYRTWAYRLDTSSESLTATPDPGAQVDQNESVEVTAYHAGITPAPDPRYPHPRWNDTTLAQRVNHAPTQWLGLGGRSGADIQLRWPYAPRAWAVLDYAGRPGADNLTTALRVAQATRFDQPTPVRLPVHVPGLPPALRLQAIDGHDPGPPDQWALRLTYATTGRPADPSTPFQALTIDVQPMNDELRAAMDDEVLGATGTLDGHPARHDLQQQPGDGYLDELQVWNVAGLRLTVTVAGQRLRDLLATDAVGIYRRLHPQPDPSTWN